MNRIHTCNWQIKKLISAIQNLCLPLRPPWCSSLCLLTLKVLVVLKIRPSLLTWMRKADDISQFVKAQYTQHSENVFNSPLTLWPPPNSNLKGLPWIMFVVAFPSSSFVFKLCYGLHHVPNSIHHLPPLPLHTLVPLVTKLTIPWLISSI